MQKLQKNIFFENFPKKVMIFYSNWPKTNLLTRAHQKGPYFSEIIFCKVFCDMSLILPEAPPKKFILCSGFDKICKKNNKSSFFALKPHNFNFIASQISCNVQMIHSGGGKEIIFFFFSFF